MCVYVCARARVHAWAFREGREQTEADREDWDVEAEGHSGTQDPRRGIVGVGVGIWPSPRASWLAMNSELEPRSPDPRESLYSQEL